MQRTVVLTLVALVIAVTLLVLGRPHPSPGGAPPTVAEPVASEGPELSSQGLAALPVRAGVRSPPSIPIPVPPPSPSLAVRRMVRARLVAIDASTNQPVDPGARFAWSFGEGSEYLDVATGSGPGTQEVAATLPAGTDETVIAVSIHGWGFRPLRRKFPLRARELEGADEVRIPLEPVEDAAWKAVRVVLAGDGNTVTEAETLRLYATPRTSPSFAPRLAVEFAPGSSRERELRVPFTPEDLDILAGPRVYVDAGRRVCVGPPRVRVDPPSDSSSIPATFTVVRLPAAILEIAIRYPPGDRPPVFDFWGTRVEDFVPEPGSSKRGGLVSTFNVRVEDGCDVVRVEEVKGRLKTLTARAAGFAGAVDPPGPLELRISEVTPVVVELTRVPQAASK